MSDYSAPLADMRFVLQELAGFTEICQLPRFGHVDSDIADAILEEAAKFASGVLAPLSPVGDRQGSHLHDGNVRTPDGFRAAYRQFIDGGWNALSCNSAYGGQELPHALSAMVEEMWRSANVSFSACGGLTRGAVEALEINGAEELRRTYLPKLVRGDWTGTMNLTEPQAGSDLSAIRTRAVRQADGRYRIFGQKIFISWGEHDLTENIIHLVLARTADAPPGVRGISMFVVPKRMVRADGTLGQRNDVRCISLEHKLGLAATPTAVLVFGDMGAASEDGLPMEPGAIGYLVGEEHRGLEYMFVMMNRARFIVGMESLGIAERAYQRAVRFAHERVQGSEITGSRRGGAAHAPAVPIVRHPDVRRMLLWMRAHVEAARALVGVVGAAMDRAHAHPEIATRQSAQAFVELMTPVVKGWISECAVDVASHGIQIHGGMGFIEETGAAQHWRESRIMPIYEGTTGIQANDLVGRKVARDGGRAVRVVIEEMRLVAKELGQRNEGVHQAIGRSLTTSIDALAAAVDFVVETYDRELPRVLAVAVPFLRLFGTVSGGWQMGRAALAAQRQLDAGTGDRVFLQSKLATARFFADHVLPHASGWSFTIVNSAEPVLDLAEECV